MLTIVRKDKEKLTKKLKAGFKPYYKWIVLNTANGICCNQKKI